MKEQYRRGRTIFLMIAAAVFVVAVVFLLAEFSNGSQKKQGIVLPPESSGPITRPTEGETNPDFVIITAENLENLIESFEIPLYYTQTLNRTIYGDGAVDISVIQIWNCDKIRKVEILQGGVTRHFLSDGETLYLWYGDDTDTVDQITLSAGLTMDDISGIPTYESSVNLLSEDILQAAYIPYTQAVDVHYLYLRTKQSKSITTDYWVDMSTGLLRMAETREGDVVLYSTDQDALTIFDTQDELLSRLQLPDGTMPFAIGAE